MSQDTHHPSQPVIPEHHAGQTVAAPAQYNRGLHILAILTMAATFPLIFMGGLVTSHQAGLAVPDWPNSYGYNMFLFPPRYWLGPSFGGVFYEHSHRLAGTVVGMLSIALALWAWISEPRRWIRWLAVGVLGAVIVQGILGGLRVIWVHLDLAIVHACVAQAFFCLSALMAAATSRWWMARFDSTTHHSAPPHSVPTDGRAGTRLIRMAVLAVGVIYAQLIVGAIMRHYQAGLAIPDFPSAYGGLLPPMDAASIEQANGVRADLGLEPTTQGQIWIHFAHRIGAVLVVAAVLHVIIETLRHRRGQPLLVRPALLLIVLVTVQFTLGALTVLWRKPADIASAHVAVGALTLVTTFILCVRAIRLRATGLLAMPAAVRTSPGPHLPATGPITA